MRCRYTKWSLVIIVISSIILLVSYSPNESQNSEYTSGNVLEKRTHEGKQNSLKGGLVLETLQVLKDPKEFSENVNKIGRKDWHLAEYLMNTGALSVKFAKLTEMGDPQAMALPVIKKNATRKTETIIYNRINKCGSSTLLTLLSGVMYKNDVQLALQGSPTHRFFVDGQKTELAGLACSNQTALISRYFFYTDLREFGCDPQYFTMMRDPVHRFHSRYRFNREILPRLSNPKIIRQSQGRSKNINSCILSSHSECSYTGTLPRWHKQFELDSQIPFLCGDSEECRTLGHPAAVNLSIENIERSFVVVGVLEQLDKTVEVMECLMPNVMKGLVESYKSSNVHKKGKHSAMASAVMTEESRKEITKRLGPEFEVYNYVVQRLERQWEECVGSGSSKD